MKKITLLFLLGVVVSFAQESKNEKFDTYAKDRDDQAFLGLIKPDSIKILEHESNLNMPYTHREYMDLEYYYDRSDNSHTAVKPYVYNEISQFADLDAQKHALMKKRKTWFGRKLLNEHFIQAQGKDYWFTIDPLVDLQLGKDNSDLDYTYNNTRGIQIQGSLGKKFSFSTTFLESQGRFAEYVNQYAESIKPDGGNPAIIPGRGIAKEHGENAYDYPVGLAYLSYTPSKFFNFQFGHGKNFIGDGYRSMFMSEASSPNPYFRINTTFWKIKYTNIWTWNKDVRSEETVDGVYATKLTATHYLSINATKKLNLGFFESVLWDPESNDRGFDVNYINPIIFYRSIEFATGSRGGNALVGFSAKYKWTPRFNTYMQIMLDELTVGEIGTGNGYWGNKSGFQIGAKYHHAFGIKNLNLQGEYNSARPYTYSHRKVILNYGNTNQPVAHLWGANFQEVVGIAYYQMNRWYVNAKGIIGFKGFDIDSTPDVSYGGDIYKSYDDRVADYGNEIGQGNKTDIFIGDLQLGYIVNPATNLKLFGGITYRNFTPEFETATLKENQTTWITVGIRTDIFDWQFDF